MEGGGRREEIRRGKKEACGGNGVNTTRVKCGGEMT